MKLIHILTVATLAAASGAQSQTTPASGADHSTHHPAAGANQAASQTANQAANQADGEVRKIDKAQGKLTLRHGPLQNLDMPAMTMVFRVVDPKMLDTLKEGDKVKFTADKVNGAITVTSIQPAK